MDSISITVTGALGDAPAQGVTRAGKAWASFSLAVEVSSGRRDASGNMIYDTRWYKVWCYGALAEHAAASLVKGDRVTVRADDLGCSAWAGKGPDQEPRGQAELRAYDVAASMRWETLVTAKAARAGAGLAANQDAPDGDPWAGGGHAARDGEVPEVLAGVTR